MKLKIKKATAEKIGYGNLEKFGIEVGRWAWRDTQEIDATTFEPEQLEKFRKLLIPHVGDKAITRMLEYLEAYAEPDAVGDTKATSVEDFANRAKLSSRCIARIAYQLPDKKAQARIWRILADKNKARLHDDDIKEIVKYCGDFSGRDIKNLLKLAMLSHGGDYITREIIDQVKVYKPTTQAKD